MSGSRLCNLWNETVISKIELCFLSSCSYTHINVRDLYIFRIGLSILLQGNMWTNPGNILIVHRHMNVEIWTEAGQFPEKEYINWIFLAVVALQIRIIWIRMRLFLSYKTGSGSFHVATWMAIVLSCSLQVHGNATLYSCILLSVAGDEESVLCTLYLAGKILKSCHIRLYNVNKNLQVRSGSGKIKWIHTDLDLQHCKLPLHSLLFLCVTFYKGRLVEAGSHKKMSSILDDQ